MSITDTGAHAATYRVYMDGEPAMVVDADSAAHAIEQAKEGLGAILRGYGRPGAYAKFLRARWYAEPERYPYYEKH